MYFVSAKKLLLISGILIWNSALFARPSFREIREKESAISEELVKISDQLLLSDELTARELISQLDREKEERHFRNLPALSRRLLIHAKERPNQASALISAALHLSPSSPDIALEALGVSIRTEPNMISQHLDIIGILLDGISNDSQFVATANHFGFLAFCIVLMTLAFAVFSVVIFRNWPLLWIGFETNRTLQKIGHLKPVIFMVSGAIAVLFLRPLEATLIAGITAILIARRRELIVVGAALFLTLIVPLLVVISDRTQTALESPMRDVLMIQSQESALGTHYDLLRLTPKPDEKGYFAIRFSQALFFEDLGDDSAATEIYESLLISQPRDARVLNNLGAIALRSGSQERALQFFSKASDADPKNLFAHYNLARLHTSLFNLAEAERHLAAAESINPSLLSDLKKREAERTANGSITKRPVSFIPASARLSDGDGAINELAQSMSKGFIHETAFWKSTFWQSWFTTLPPSLASTIGFLLCFAALLFRISRRTKPLECCTHCGQPIEVGEAKAQPVCNACLNLSTQKQALDPELCEKREQEQRRYSRNRRVISLLTGAFMPGSNLLLASKPGLAFGIMATSAVWVSFVIGICAAFSMSLAHWLAIPIVACVWVPLAAISILQSSKEPRRVA